MKARCEIQAKIKVQVGKAPMSSPDINYGSLSPLDEGPFHDINAQFVLNSGYLVFFMHCGFAMISVGCVRQRFAKHVALLVLMDACASALGWYLTGYAFAWGDNTASDGQANGNYFIGTNFFAMHALPPYADSVNSFYLWFFQWAFAATACTIVSGAIAERTKFEAYIMYSFFMAAWVYPIVVHACWSSSGWESHFRTSADEPHFLVGSGVIDFAGSQSPPG
ncbi:hypothetical protein WJX84_008932 [Apatococcus fuscideae]|uniref:Ammonium transporter AmtB-like domain-containing protein n=1 Tax=Apatococcus fuscideae TaxID=2026836 RepID=A0AAW1T124_9CHLO